MSGAPKVAPNSLFLNVMTHSAAGETGAERSDPKYHHIVLEGRLRRTDKRAVHKPFNWPKPNLSCFTRF